MKRKEIKDVIKKFTYKNKKSLCIFMVLAVLAGGIVIVKINSYKSQQTIDSENYARTVFVEKGEINRSINVNGKIESAEVSMVSTSLTEKVKSVNVKVGDYVKAGDVICTLDDGDITKEIEKKKAEIAENKKELVEAVSTSIKGVIEAERKKLVTMNVKKENLDKVKKVMPAMTGPTISEVLSKEETVAVQAVIDEDVVFELVNDLRNAGAKDILVVPIERII